MKSLRDMKINLKDLIKIILLILLGFLILTGFVTIFPSSFLDYKFSVEIQKESKPIIDKLMKGISWFGNTPVSILMVVLTALTFFISHYRKEALFVLLTLFSGILNYGVKVLVNRPRPSDDLIRIMEKAKYQSFPSGHTVFYVVFFGFLVLLMVHLKKINKRIRVVISIISLLMIFAVPVSRIYLGAHWFTDVLGGLLLGLSILFLLSFTYFFYPKPRSP